MIKKSTLDEKVKWCYIDIGANNNILTMTVTAHQQSYASKDYEAYPEIDDNFIWLHLDSAKKGWLSYFYGETQIRAIIDKSGLDLLENGDASHFMIVNIHIKNPISGNWEYLVTHTWVYYEQFESPCDLEKGDLLEITAKIAYSFGQFCMSNPTHYSVIKKHTNYQFAKFT